MAEVEDPQQEGPQPFRTPPADPDSPPKDPHIQSPLDMEVFRFLGLTGTVLAPAAWAMGAFGIDNPWFAVPWGLAIMWLLYLVVRRALVLTRDMDKSIRAGEGDGVIDAVGWSWQQFGSRGTHLGLLVIDGVDYGVSRKTARSFRPGAHVRVWYYESSKHIIRIEEIPAWRVEAGVSLGGDSMPPDLRQQGPG